MIAIDTKALRELAEKATEGPWVQGNTDDDQIMLIGEGGNGDYVCHITIHQYGGGIIAALMQPARKATACYIAAANPQTFLRLLDHIDAQAARIMELEEALRPFAAAVDELDENTPEYLQCGDDLCIGVALWEEQQPTVGDLRRARAALERKL